MFACMRPAAQDEQDDVSGSPPGGSPQGSRRSSSRRNSGASPKGSPTSSRRSSAAQNSSTSRRSQLDLQIRAMVQAGGGKTPTTGNTSRRRSSQNSVFSDDSAFGPGSPLAGGKGKLASIVGGGSSCRRTSSKDSVKSSGSRRHSSGLSPQSSVGSPIAERPMQVLETVMPSPASQPQMSRSSSSGCDSAVSASSQVSLEPAPSPPQQRKTDAAAVAAAAAMVAREPLFGHPRFRKLRDINRGSHGFVQLAVDLKTGNEVAIKFIKRGSNMQAKSILRELLNQRLCLQHPHIVGLEEVFLTPYHLGIAMEYANGGDLSDYIADHVNRKGTSVPEKEARRIFQQMIVAIHYCHRLGIANRDVKLDNVLLHNGFTAGQPAQVKLCDFGYSKSMGSNCITACGTPEYMAPEVMSEKVYDGKKVDVWSCGCTLFVMLAGVFPFLKMSEEELAPSARLRKMYPRIHSGITNPIPKASPAAKDLLSRMLTPDPAKRMTVPEVLAHPWVTEDMPQGLGDLNDDILLSSPRTAARRGVMASLARRDAAFGTGPGQGGFSVGQTEEQLVAIVEACCREAHQDPVIR